MRPRRENAAVLFIESVGPGSATSSILLTFPARRSRRLHASPFHTVSEFRRRTRNSRSVVLSVH